MTDDSISRQAAIDLFPNDVLEWDTFDGYIAPHLARRLIKDLPSAQPTYTDDEIQKMQDLEQAQIEKAYQLGREDAQTEKWIPVTERLPKEDDEYLITLKDRHGDTFVKKTMYFSDDDLWWDISPFETVTAWMPVPKPYEGEE